MSVNEYLKKFGKVEEKLYFLNWLDYNATGIMLFTNSSELKSIAEKIADSKYSYLYRVKIDENLDENKLKKMI